MATHDTILKSTILVILSLLIITATVMNIKIGEIHKSCDAMAVTLKELQIHDAERKHL